MNHYFWTNNKKHKPKEGSIVNSIQEEAVVDSSFLSEWAHFVDEGMQEDAASMQDTQRTNYYDDILGEPVRCHFYRECNQEHKLRPCGHWYQRNTVPAYIARDRWNPSVQHGAPSEPVVTHSYSRYLPEQSLMIGPRYITWGLLLTCSLLPQPTKSQPEIDEVQGQWDSGIEKLHQD